jgi:hypothetical protein
MLSEVCCYIRAMVAAPASASPWTTVFKLFGRFFTFIPKPILSENSTALLLYRGMYQAYNKKGQKCFKNVSR